MPQSLKRQSSIQLRSESPGEQAVGVSMPNPHVLVKSGRQRSRKGNSESKMVAVFESSRPDLNIRELQRTLDELMQPSQPKVEVLQKKVVAKSFKPKAQTAANRSKTPAKVTSLPNRKRSAAAGSPAPASSGNQPVASPKKKHETSRVQLRLSKQLVRLLAAFAQSGQRPSKLIEKTMWRDARIRDAAAILGIKLVQTKGKPVAR